MKKWLFTLVCLVMLLMGMDILKWVWSAYWAVLRGYDALLIIEPANVYLLECFVVGGCMLLIIIFLLKRGGGG